MMRSALLPAVLLIVAACASQAPQTDVPENNGDGQIVTEPAVALTCEPAERMPLEGRASPYDSTTAQVGAVAMKVCYGRPAVRGREIFGGLVRYDTIWRTGANEPTIIHLSGAAQIAGIQVTPGSYSLYTVPGRDSWTVIVNRAIDQWGHESAYTEAVRQQEVGRATVETERLDQLVEQFTIRTEPAGGGVNLLLEWERTRVRIPIRAR